MSQVLNDVELGPEDGIHLRVRKLDYTAAVWMGSQTVAQAMGAVFTCAPFSIEESSFSIDESSLFIEESSLLLKNHHFSTTLTSTTFPTPRGLSTYPPPLLFSHALISYLEYLSSLDCGVVVGGRTSA